MSSADPRLRALLKLAPVIPVYTPEDVNEAVDVAQALFRGGLPVIEVTLRTPQALDAIKAMVEAVPDAVIGAGTVLNAAQMQAAKQANGRATKTLRLPVRSERVEMISMPKMAPI